ncbi:hypothetical protein EIN_153950, partial [Entamoeba invadens IP1]
MVSLDVVNKSHVLMYFNQLEDVKAFSFVSHTSREALCQITENPVLDEMIIPNKVPLSKLINIFPSLKRLNCPLVYLSTITFNNQNEKNLKVYLSSQISSKQLNFLNLEQITCVPQNLSFLLQFPLPKLKLVSLSTTENLNVILKNCSLERVLLFPKSEKILVEMIDTVEALFFGKQTKSTNATFVFVIVKFNQEVSEFDKTRLSNLALTTKTKIFDFSSHTLTNFSCDFLDTNNDQKICLSFIPTLFDGCTLY